MTKKTLSESAAEILQASMMAGKEPAATLAVAQDLGGQTPENMDASSVGSNAASAVKPAAKPGIEGAPAEPAKNAVEAEVAADEEEAVEDTMKVVKEEEILADEEKDEDEEVDQVDEESKPNLKISDYPHFQEYSSAAVGYAVPGHTEIHPRVGKLLAQAESQLAAAQQKGHDLSQLGKDASEGTHNNLHQAYKMLGKAFFDFEEYSPEETELSTEEIAEAKKAMMKEMIKKHSKPMKEDVDALFNGESLSEDFRVKATLIFEAAVNSRVEGILEDVLVENDEILLNAVEDIKAELTEQVDEYLNYVVEEWVKDNQVAIESGLRSELAEDFISGLKNLFAEHYIELPEEKIDVAEELAGQVVAMEESVADKDATIASLTEEINTIKKEKSIRLACEGLTEVQAGKMKSLAEGVEFTTEGDFEHKLAVIRENYFPSKVQVKSEVKEIQKTTVNEEPEVAQVNGIMAHYVKALSKTAPKA